MDGSEDGLAEPKELPKAERARKVTARVNLMPFAFALLLVT